MKQDFSEYIKMLNAALDTVSTTWLDFMVEEIVRISKSNGRLFVCGNGGSAAISEHFSCDHSKGICTDTNIKPFVVPLASNVSLITAIGNDIGFEEIFSKQIEWFGDWNDGLLVISSSGNSPNIINALKMAKKNNLSTMALVGFDGGKAKDLAQISVHVNSNNYGIVEDCHQIIMHSMAQHIRKTNAKNPKSIKL